MTKKTSESKNRKRLSQNIGDVLTSQRALHLLKKRENATAKNKAGPGPSKSKTPSKKQNKKSLIQKKKCDSSSSSDSVVDIVLESEFECEDFDEENNLSDEEVLQDYGTMENENHSSQTYHELLQEDDETSHQECAQTYQDETKEGNDEAREDDTPQQECVEVEQDNLSTSQDEDTLN